MTSVDFTMASASSPRRSFNSSTASRVMTAVSDLTADTQPHLREQAVDPDFLDDSAQLIASAQRDDTRGCRARACALVRGPLTASSRSISASATR